MSRDISESTDQSWSSHFGSQISSSHVGGSQFVHYKHLSTGVKSENKNA